MTFSTTSCPANTWTKVSTAQTSGIAQALSRVPGGIHYAIVATGAAAPTTITDKPIFRESIIGNASGPSDLYVYPVNVAVDIRVGV